MYEVTEITINNLLKEIPFRFIKVWRDKNDRKQTNNDHCNYTIKQISDDKGIKEKCNYYSFYLKYSDIYCLDIDQKDLPEEINILIKMYLIPFTITKYGYHLFFKTNLDKFKNEINIFKNFKGDLFHFVHNIWEPYDNKVYNSQKVPFIDKSEIEKLINEDKIKIKENQKSYIKLENKKTILKILNDGQNATSTFFYEKNKDNILIANSHIYIYNDDTQLWIKSSKNKFIAFISKYLFNKIKKQINKEKENQKKILKYAKMLNKFTTTRYIDDLSKQILGIFDEIDYWDKLDNNKEEINFKNGIYNLKKGIFRKREKNDYITKYLDFDFNNTINEEINLEINKMIFNISNDDKELTQFNLNWLGYCLSGETKEKLMLFCVGYSASNGKSALGRMYHYSLPIYSTEIDNKTFNEGYSKVHKQLSNVNKPVRFVIIEELSKNKLDVNLFKKFVDGNEITNEVLYGTTEKIIVQGKLYITSNNDPRFITDNGIIRRGLEEVLTNKFLKEEDYEKEKNKKGIYKRDQDFDNKFMNNNNYKMEFIRILLPHAKQYYEKGLIIPQKIKKNFKELCEENDLMKTFVDNNFEITNDTSDRIHKDDFVEIYNEINKTKLNWTHII